MGPSPGDPVEIIDGPYAGFVGRCVRSNEDAGAIVVALNRASVSLGVDQVRPTEKRVPWRRVRVDLENPEVVIVECCSGRLPTLPFDSPDERATTPPSPAACRSRPSDEGPNSLIAVLGPRDRPTETVIENEPLLTAFAVLDRHSGM
jgi:hypothetical protein